MTRDPSRRLGKRMLTHWCCTERGLLGIYRAGGEEGLQVSRSGFERVSGACELRLLVT